MASLELLARAVSLSERRTIHSDEDLIISRSIFPRVNALGISYNDHCYSCDSSKNFLSNAVDQRIGRSDSVIQEAGSEVLANSTDHSYSEHSVRVRCSCNSNRNDGCLVTCSGCKFSQHVNCARSFLTQGTINYQCFQCKKDSDFFGEHSPEKGDLINDDLPTCCVCEVDGRQVIRIESSVPRGSILMICDDSTKFQSSNWKSVFVDQKLSDEPQKVKLPKGFLCTDHDRFVPFDHEVQLLQRAANPNVAAYAQIFNNNLQIYLISKRRIRAKEILSVSFWDSSDAPMPSNADGSESLISSSADVQKPKILKRKRIAESETKVDSPASSVSPDSTTKLLQWPLNKKPKFDISSGSGDEKAIESKPRVRRKKAVATEEKPARKLTREEKKVQHYMKLFERMEKQSKRKAIQVKEESVDDSTGDENQVSSTTEVLERQMQPSVADTSSTDPNSSLEEKSLVSTIKREVSFEKRPCKTEVESELNFEELEFKKPVISGEKVSLSSESDANKSAIQSPVVPMTFTSFTHDKDVDAESDKAIKIEAPKEKKSENGDDSDSSSSSSSSDSSSSDNSDASDVEKEETKKPPAQINLKTKADLLRAKRANCLKQRTLLASKKSKAKAANQKPQSSSKARSDNVLAKYHHRYASAPRSKYFTRGNIVKAEAVFAQKSETSQKKIETSKQDEPQSRVVEEKTVAPKSIKCIKMKKMFLNEWISEQAQEKLSLENDENDQHKLTSVTTDESSQSANSDTSSLQSPIKVAPAESYIASAKKRWLQKAIESSGTAAGKTMNCVPEDTKRPERKPLIQSPRTPIFEHIVGIHPEDSLDNVFFEPPVSTKKKVSLTEYKKRRNLDDSVSGDGGLLCSENIVFSPSVQKEAKEEKVLLMPLEAIKNRNNVKSPAQNSQTLQDRKRIMQETMKRDLERLKLRHVGVDGIENLRRELAAEETVPKMSPRIAEIEHSPAVRSVQPLQPLRMTATPKSFVSVSDNVSSGLNDLSRVSSVVEIGTTQYEMAGISDGENVTKDAMPSDLNASCMNTSSNASKRKKKRKRCDESPPPPPPPPPKSEATLPSSLSHSQPQSTMLLSQPLVQNALICASSSTPFLTASSSVPPIQVQSAVTSSTLLQSQSLIPVPIPVIIHGNMPPQHTIILQPIHDA